MKAIIDLDELKLILDTYYGIEFTIENKAIYINSDNGYIIGYFSRQGNKKIAISGYSEPGLIRDKAIVKLME